MRTVSAQAVLSHYDNHCYDVSFEIKIKYAYAAGLLLGVLFFPNHSTIIFS